MKVKPIDIALASYLHKKRYFENYRKIGKKVKKIASKILKDKKLRVIIFGSVMRGDFTPLSDLDMLIISDKVKRESKELAKLRVKLKEGLGDFFAPIEFHVVTPEIFEAWYKKFLDVYEEIS